MKEKDNALDLLELAGRVTLNLGRSNDVDKLLFEVLDSVSELGQVKDHALWSLVNDESGRVRVDSYIEVSAPLEKFSDSLKSKAITILRSFLTEPDSRKGVHRLSIDSDDVYAFVIGDPSVGGFVLSLRFAQVFSSAPILAKLLELIAAQASISLKWLQKIDKTESLIYKDDLTGLYNSRFLEDSLDREIRRAGRFQSPFSLLFIDLDNFKGINDRFGHLVGSDMLKQFGELLRGTLRDIDSIIRYGGDEFVIILLGTSSSAAVLAGNRIRKKVSENKFHNLNGNEPVSITCSIGVASFPEHSESKEGLLKMADDCMYKSKNRGKNRVTLFNGNDDLSLGGEGER